MILACLAGIVIGAVVSVPLGALGAIMIDRTLREGLWAGLSIGLMSAGATALCCEVSLRGITFLQTMPGLQVTVQVLGLLLLIIVGLRYIVLPHRKVVSTPTMTAHENTRSTNPWTSYIEDLLLVLAYTFLNPTSYAFWVNLAGALRSTMLQLDDFSQSLIFSGGVAIGSAISQYVSLILLQRSSRRFPATEIFVRRIGGVVFAATVITFGYSLGTEIAGLVNRAAL